MTGPALGLRGLGVGRKDEFMASYWIEKEFDYQEGDGPLDHAVPAGAVVGRRIVSVVTAWDAVATLQVGIDTDADKYVRAVESNLQGIGTYTVDGADHEWTQEDIYLDFEHGGATQGAGVLLIEIIA